MTVRRLGLILALYATTSACKPRIEQGAEAKSVGETNEQGKFVVYNAVGDDVFRYVCPDEAAAAELATKCSLSPSGGGVFDEANAGTNPVKWPLVRADILSAPNIDQRIKDNVEKILLELQSSRVIKFAADNQSLKDVTALMAKRFGVTSQGDNVAGGGAPGEFQVGTELKTATGQLGGSLFGSNGTGTIFYYYGAEGDELAVDAIKWKANYPWQSPTYSKLVKALEASDDANARPKVTLKFFEVTRNGRPEDTYWLLNELQFHAGERDRILALVEPAATPVASGPNCDQIVNGTYKNGGFYKGGDTRRFQVLASHGTAGRVQWQACTQMYSSFPMTIKGDFRADGEVEACSISGLPPACSGDNGGNSGPNCDQIVNGTFKNGVFYRGTDSRRFEVLAPHSTSGGAQWRACIQRYSSFPMTIKGDFRANGEVEACAISGLPAGC